MHGTKGCRVFTRRVDLFFIADLNLAIFTGGFALGQLHLEESLALIEFRREKENTTTQLYYCSLLVMQFTGHEVMASSMHF